MERWRSDFWNCGCSGMLRGAGGRVVSAGSEEMGTQWALGREWGWLQEAIFDSLLF